MKYFFTFAILLHYSFLLFANPIEPIVVTNQTIKITSEQRFFYAFEAGDNIIIDIEMVKGKELKEFEIIAYPNSSKFKALKVSQLDNKKIRVFQRGIFEFRIKAAGSKTIKFTIKRQPSSTGKTAFDTNVKWRIIKDSIRKNYSEKITLRYDTTWVTKQRKILKKIDTTFTTLVDRKERIHSRTNLSVDNISTLQFELPKNKIEALSTKKVISWSYWMGVGQVGIDNYNKELRLFMLKVSGKVMSKNMLAGIALGTYALAVNPPEGDNIIYKLEVNKTKVSEGNITSSFGRETKQLQGKIDLELNNDNIINGIDVGLKIVVVLQQKIYEMQAYQERLITPIENIDSKGKIVIKERKIPYID